MLLVPRLVATVLPSPIPLNSTTRLKSRSYDRGEWSALNEAIFRTSVPPTSDALRISEIHYHPADPTDQEIAAGFEDADDFEFIEIVNVSGDTVDLSTVAFIRTILETSPESPMLKASTSVDALLCRGTASISEMICGHR